MGFGVGFRFEPLGNGDNKSGSGGTGLGVGLWMGDLGEPPCKCWFFFFSDEVALNRRGSHSLDSAMLRVVEVRKPNRSFSAGERSQSSQPRSSNNVPSVPKVNVTTGRTANASHRQRIQDANFACTIYACLQS